MAIEVDHTWDLPYTPAALFEQGIRRDFIEKMAKATGQRHLNIMELEHGPEGGRAVARYEVDVELPSWATKFLPANNKMTETREWGPAEADGSRHYTVRIKPDHAPITIVGTIGLIAVGASTRNTVHFDVTAQMAILGKKLEEMTAADVSRTAQEQHDFMLSWMKSH